MRYSDVFGSCHPAVNFLYFVLVIAFSMCLTHPVCLLLSVCGAVIYHAVLLGPRSLRKSAVWMVPMAVLAAVINPAFTHQGVTILAYLPSGNPLTLESMLYGLASAALLSATLLWFSCYNTVMTSDKFIYLFGRVIPALSLVLSMTMRFVPRFRTQLHTVAQAQKYMGRDTENGSLLRRTKNAMKVFMALLNFWIAFVYYHIYCEPREYNDLLTLFWAIMGCMWIYDLAARNATLERTGHHTGFALLLFAMPFIYPLCSLALGREFPMITSPVMPCSVAVFTLALMLAFAERVNIILAMLLGHWALVGLSKVYYFGIPEDYLLACSVVPALYVFLREYIVAISQRPSKPSPRVLNGLLGVLCIIIGLFIAYTLLHQFNLFSEI